MRPRLLLLGVVLVLAGCGSTGTTVRDEGPAALGDKAIVSPAAAVGEDTAAAVPAVPASGSGFVYLLRYDQPEPTRRSIPSDLTVPEGSLRALLEGPSLAERVLDYSSAIPEDSRLLGYSALNRTAIVDLTKLPPIAADAQSERIHKLMTRMMFRLFMGWFRYWKVQANVTLQRRRGFATYAAGDCWAILSLGLV